MAFIIMIFCCQIRAIKLSTDNASSVKKAHRRNEEKININIFLAHNIPELDLHSDTECGGVGQSNIQKSVKN